MSDYRVVVKVQNGRIYEKIRAKGFANISRFCEAHGLGKSQVGDLLNLKLSPVNRDGKFKNIVTRLAEALEELPENLFTERQYEAVPSNVRDFLIEERHIAELLAPNMEHGFALIEMAEGIQSRANLTNKEQAVIDMRFKYDKTLDEVAHSLDVTRERVRQIEGKALRKMRNPYALGDICYEDVAE